MSAGQQRRSLPRSAQRTGRETLSAAALRQAWPVPAMWPVPAIRWEGHLTCYNQCTGSTGTCIDDSPGKGNNMTQDTQEQSKAVARSVLPDEGLAAKGRAEGADLTKQNGRGAF